MTTALLLLLTLSSCASLERGKASFYGSRGGKTASGERVNPKALTAAHRTLPFNTIVEVRAPKTGKRVRVRITDRGPYIRGRIIDLTPAAFQRLAPLKWGVIEVTLRIIKRGKKRRKRRKKARRKRGKSTTPTPIGPFGPQGPVLMEGGR